MYELKLPDILKWNDISQW